MHSDIELHDDDQGRTYHLQVSFTCRPEIGAAPGYLVEVHSLWLDSCVCWFDKQGSEVAFEYSERIAAARFVERKYLGEIRELCYEAWQREREQAA